MCHFITNLPVIKLRVSTEIVRVAAFLLHVLVDRNQSLIVSPCRVFNNCVPSVPGVWELGSRVNWVLR